MAALCHPLKNSAVRSRYHENRPEIGRRKCAKSPITQPQIVRFRSKFVQSLKLNT